MPAAGTHLLTGEEVGIKLVRWLRGKGCKYGCEAYIPFVAPPRPALIVGVVRNAGKHKDEAPSASLRIQDL
jgi:hypothetical protein